MPASERRKSTTRGEQQQSRSCSEDEGGEGGWVQQAGRTGEGLVGKHGVLLLACLEPLDRLLPRVDANVSMSLRAEINRLKRKAKDDPRWREQEDEREIGREGAGGGSPYKEKRRLRKEGARRRILGAKEITETGKSRE
eukprot:746239-Hanusia_phi.AAC.19